MNNLKKTKASLPSDRDGTQTTKMGGVRTMQLIAEQLKLGALADLNTPETVHLTFNKHKTQLTKLKWSEKKRLVRFGIDEGQLAPILDKWQASNRIYGQHSSDHNRDQIGLSGPLCTLKWAIQSSTTDEILAQDKALHFFPKATLEHIRLLVQHWRTFKSKDGL